MFIGLSGFDGRNLATAGRMMEEHVWSVSAITVAAAAITAMPLAHPSRRTSDAATSR